MVQSVFVTSQKSESSNIGMEVNCIHVLVHQQISVYIM